MFCRNCKAEVAEGAVACTSCGLAPTQGDKFCGNCGDETTPGQEVCVGCGHRLVSKAASGAKSKMVAGILGILVGGLGIHRFYLGYTTMGIIMVAVQVAGQILGPLTCGIGYALSGGVAVWGLVEGIMILVGSMNEDADGNALAD